MDTLKPKLKEEVQEIEEVVETVKEPGNSIWVSAKKGDLASIEQHIAYGSGEKL